MPASAQTLPEVTVTPEMSTSISLVSVDPSDCRETVITLPPPSRRYGWVPANVPPVWTGSMVTLSAPAPLILSGLLIVRPFIAPAATGLEVLFTGVDDSWYTPGHTTMVSQGAA